MKKLADWAITVYYKFKRDVVTDKTVLDQTEETVGGEEEHGLWS